MELWPKREKPKWARDRVTAEGSLVEGLGKIGLKPVEQRMFWLGWGNREGQEDGILEWKGKGFVLEIPRRNGWLRLFRQSAGRRQEKIQKPRGQAAGCCDAQCKYLPRYL
jgi:hypothetical protein